MSDAMILTEQQGLAFHIILNRADKRNAITWAMMDELGAALNAAERAYNAGDVRALIIRANGNVFSSGIDISSFMDNAEKYGENWRNNLFPSTDDMQHVLMRLENSSLPSIVLLHGYCLGLALELALACDIRIAAERTLLGLPETRLGIIPDVGGTTRLLKVAGVARAKELIMTGRQFRAEDAERWGIVNYVVPSEGLMAKADELVAELALSAPLAVSYAKRSINDMLENQRHLQIEAWAQAQLFRTQDFERAVMAMLTKTYPITWEGK